MLWKTIKKKPAVVWLRKEYWRHRSKRELKKYSDYEFLRRLYRKELGRELDLSNPQRYTEKLQWLKLFWRHEDAPICSNKYAVRKYLEERGYGSILNELYAVYDDADLIDPKELPEQFVLKASHGSGWNLIVKDKSKVNWFWWKKIMRSWMKQNLYWFGREWNYATQKPSIVIEKYLEDDSGELRDYKIICTNGQPRFFQVDENRATNHKRMYVDCEGNLLNFQDTFGYGEIKKIPFSDAQRKMVEIAKDLCKPFPYVRVDFYECNGKIYFGEMTYFTHSGIISFDPDEMDYELGKLIELPAPNHNLELYNRLFNG